MAASYQARWITKTRADALRKQARAQGGILLSGFNGMIVVEPKGMHLGDGRVLSSFEADYEIQPVWCFEPKTKIDGARKLLGLERMTAKENERNAFPVAAVASAAAT
jgi:hypothetical protein